MAPSVTADTLFDALSTGLLPGVREACGSVPPSVILKDPRGSPLDGRNANLQTAEVMSLRGFESLSLRHCGFELNSTRQALIEALRADD